MFAEFLRKNSYEIEFERIGVRTGIRPLSEDELIECARMKGDAGARYALYLACPALHEEGERLFGEGALFSPVDITNALDLSDINAAYRYIKDISGMGESRVRLYKNEIAAGEGFDSVGTEQEEAYDEVIQGVSVPKEGSGEAIKGEKEESGIEAGSGYGSIGVSRSKMTDKADFACVLAEGLKRAAGNM